MSTKIQWCDETWNPVVGCSKVSAGCHNCYAEAMAIRLACMPATAAKYRPVVTEKGWNGNIHVDEWMTEKPLHWKKPRRIFVCSMGDLFHEKVTDSMINKVQGIAAQCPRHTFLFLTKRAERMRAFYAWYAGAVINNVWLGVTAEDQKQADERIWILAQTPASRRFVSIEPMLERITLPSEVAIIDQIICGCESGRKARATDMDWIRDLRDQCIKLKIPFFLKQMKIDGELVKMPELDGKVWAEYPE